MKNTFLILSAASIVILLLMTGTSIATTEIVNQDNEEEETIEEIEAAKMKQIPIQAFSQDIPPAENTGLRLGTPLIILLAGFTAIVAGVNYRLNKE